MTDQETAARILEKLNKRQRKSIWLLVNGYTSNQAIADHLGSTQQVVKNNFTVIFDAFGVWDRVELAVYILRNPALESALNAEQEKTT